MGFEAWIAGSIQTPLLPYHAWALVGEVTLLLLAAIASLSLARQTAAVRWRVWAVLLATAPLASAVLILRLPALGLSSLPGLPLTVPPVAAGVLTFIPALLSAGLAGPLPTLLIGLGLGLTRAILDTHQVMTISEYGLIAGWIALLMRNDYAGGFFTWLRRPWGAAIAALPAGVVLRALGDWSLARGDLLTTLDFVTSRLAGHTLGLGLELLAAAAVCEFVRLGIPSVWPEPARLTTTRFQRSLVWHLSLWVTVPFSLMAVVILAAVIVQTRQQARSDLLAQAGLTASHAAEAIPAAVITGQTLLEDMSTDVARLVNNPEALAQYFADRLRQPPYFQQLAFLPQPGRVTTSVPALADPLCGSIIESEGCALAFSGSPWIGWVDISGSVNPWLEMIQPVSAAPGRPAGILIGRTSFEINPLLAPIQAALGALPESHGMLLDRDNIVLYPADAEPWSEEQPAGSDELGGSWYFGITSDGRRRLSYVLPLSYPEWKVALRVPEAVAFSTSLHAGLSIGLLTLLVTLVTQMLVIVIAQRITRPLRQVVHAASALAAGDLDRRIDVGGEDEFAALGRAFELMRHNLQRQMRDQDLLLQASQGVATHMELLPACLPILQSALSSAGAHGARIVLAEGHTALPGPQELAAGELASSMAPLDAHILAHVRDRSPWLVADVTKSQEFFPVSLTEHIGALIALRLSRGERFHGALWLAFHRPQVFDTGTVDLLSGLAGQASLAVTNATLLETTESERQRFATILAAIPDGVVMTDADGRVLFANAAARRLLGSILPETGGRVGSGGQAGGLAQALAEASPDGRTFEFAAADGRRLLATTRPVAGSRSVSLGRVCLLQDVTRFRQLEDLKTEFVNTVSHDLRRPLTLVDGHVNMLEMLGPLNPAQKEYVVRIREGVSGMARLVSDLLDLGRIEQGIEAHASPIDVRALLEKLVEEYRPEAASRSIRLEVVRPEDFPSLTADAALLERALGNMVDNAIRYNRHNGSVHLRVAAQEGQVVFSVEDSGVGIAPADMPRLFERFYQVSRPDLGDTRGWGLGLAIVRSVADWHHGRAWAESQLGKGSTFFFALPARP
jgi:signal transduction histidine kinase/HAMP domain-containing protein